MKSKLILILALAFLLFPIQIFATETGNEDAYNEMRDTIERDMREALSTSNQNLFNTVFINDKLYTYNTDFNYDTTFYAIDLETGIPSEKGVLLKTSEYIDKEKAQEGQYIAFNVFQGKDSAYFLERINKVLIKIESENDELKITKLTIPLDKFFDLFQGDAYLETVNANDKYFFFTAYHDSTGSFYGWLDLATGDVSKFDGDKYTFNDSITIKNDGSAYLSIYNNGNLTYDLVSPQNPDPKTLEFNIAQAYTSFNFYVDQISDKIYFTNDSKIFYLNEETKSAEPITYLKLKPGSSNLYVNNGKAYVTSYNADQSESISINIIDLSQTQLNAVEISTTSDLDTEFAQNFNYQNDDIKISNRFYLHTDDVIARTIKNNEGLDIIAKDADELDFKNFIKHGYLADLSSSEKIKNYIDNLYPYLKNMIDDFGGYYVVPISVSFSNSPSFNKDALEMIDMKDQIPTTYQEFIEFVKDFIENKMDEFPEVQLMSEMDSLAFIPYQIMSSYFYKQLANHEEVNLLSPVLKEIFKVYDEIDLPKELGEPDYSKMNILEGSIYTFGKEKLSQYDKLSFGDDFGAFYLADVRLIAVNDLSPNKEKAIETIERIIDLVSQEDKTYLLQTSNEPVVNESFAQDLVKLNKELEYLKKRQETATEELEKSTLKLMIENKQDRLKFVEDNYYIIKEDDIKRIKEEIQHVVPFSRPLFSTKETTELVSKLLLKKITGIEFLQEFDRVYHMSLLEQQ